MSELSSSDGSHREALSHAIAAGIENSMKRLLTCHPELLEMVHPVAGCTPLFEAVQGKHLTAVNTILAAGANIHAPQGPHLLPLKTPWRAALGPPAQLEILHAMIEQLASDYNGLRRCADDLEANAHHCPSTVEMVALVGILDNVVAKLERLREPLAPQPHAISKHHNRGGR